MADLAAAGAAEAAGLADAERREVVVEDEPLLGLAAAVGVESSATSSRAPSVASATAWVSPRAKSAEPWARGSRPTSAGERADVVEGRARRSACCARGCSAERLLLQVVERLRDLERGAVRGLLESLGLDLLAQAATAFWRSTLPGL